MTADKLTIEVDGRPLPANPAQMLIEVTDANDIYIPRFCYHKKLSVAANCRMCLVEVENMPKPVPACATPVAAGMKVLTQSALAIEAQKSVMEFLLINHPLDCPICDQGGECELQDLAMGYGSDVSRYQEAKRVVKDKNIGPLIQTDMTRCIHCTRCIRFGEEVAGLRELGATGRGEHMEIGTYIAGSVSSELSGNVIDICPVGALTSKPFRFSARAWEMEQKKTIAPHDSVGSNIYLHIKDNRVLRVVPAENEAVNEIWLSDRDRFSYEGLYSRERLQAPMIKQYGSWQKTDWETALAFTRDQIQKSLSEHGGSQIGALASPAATLEELYLFQKLLRNIGCHNIDCRLRQHDFAGQESDPSFLWLGQSIAALQSLDAILLIGSQVRKEQPMINHRLHQAVVDGAALMTVNSVDYAFNYEVCAKLLVTPDDLPYALAGIVKILAELSGDNIDESLQTLVSEVTVTEEHRYIADCLTKAENGTVLLGNLAVAHPQFSVLKYLSAVIAKLAGVKLGFIAEAANTVGAHLVGVLPHRGPGGKIINPPGLDARAMLAQPLRTYMLLGIEPELDCWNGREGLAAMQAARCVIMMTAYRTEVMERYAKVLLPIALFAETAGSYINAENRLQSFPSAVPPIAEARPAWKILRVLGNLLGLDGFEYHNSADIKHEALELIAEVSSDNQGNWCIAGPLASAPSEKLQRIAQVPMNAIDPITRRACALQSTGDVADGAAHINSSLAKKLGISAGDRVVVKQDETEVNMPVVIDNEVVSSCVLIHAAQPSHRSLDGWHGYLSLKKA